MAYTTTDLLADIDLRAFIPTSQNTFTEAQRLLLADQSMQTLVLPLVQSLRSEYYVTYKDVAITAGQAAYDIPVRAVGMLLREIHIVTSAGDVLNLPQVDPDTVESTGTGAPAAFFIRQNQVHLYPTPSTSINTLRLYYFLRPSKHVLTSACGLITAIAGSDVTVSSAPSAWTTGNTFDLVRQDGGSEPLAFDQAVSAIAGTTITFSSAPPSTLRVGDYVSLAGETPIPQVPAELRPVLAQDVAVKIMNAMNLPGKDDAKKALELEVEAVKMLLTPRVHGETQKVVAQHGWL